VIRSGKFDSFLVGSSTIHSVDPQWAEAAFGGHFANVAIHGLTPYEASRVVTLIGNDVPGLRRLVLRLDAAQWCDPVKAAQRYHAKAVLPENLYDADRFAHFVALLNGKMVEISLRQLAVDLAIKPAPVPANGYRNELDEAKWKPFKPDQNSCTLNCDGTVTPAARGVGAAKVGDSEDPFPAHRLLEQAFASLPAQAEIIVALMPRHVSALPSDAAGRAKLGQCKRHIEALVSRHAGFTIDFDIASPWTTKDDNYWDASHFRIGLAKALMQRVKEAVERRRDAEDGVYRTLAGPGSWVGR